MNFKAWRTTDSKRYSTPSGLHLNGSSTQVYLIMPPRAKRKGDFDPTKSDSEDETYAISVSKPSKPRSSRAQQGSSSRKKRRRIYSGDESEDIVEESELSGGLSVVESEDEEVEIGPSGRPRRKAAKKRLTYEESGSDNSSDGQSKTEAKDTGGPVKRKHDKPSLVVMLRTTPRAVSSRRNTRARSGSVGTSRPSSSHVQISTTRRSSRIANNDTEEVVALTNSGNHVDVIRPGMRSPPAVTTRSTKGGKGVKKMPANVVYEEDEQSPARTKEDLDVDDLQSGKYPPEIAASLEYLGEEGFDLQLEPTADIESTQPNSLEKVHAQDEVAVIPESGEDDAHDEDDENPISKPGRTLRRRESKRTAISLNETTNRGGGRSTGHTLRSTLGKRKTRSSQRSGHQESSDFEPGFEGGEEDVSDSEALSNSPGKASFQHEEDEISPARRGAKRRKVNPRSHRASEEHDSEVAEELAEELDELRGSRSRRVARSTGILYEDKPKTRQRKPVDYRILRPDLNATLDDDGEPSATTPSRRGRGGASGTWQRSLFSTYGPFGGAGGPTPVFGGPHGVGAAAGADSDSSDDETSQRQRPSGIGGAVGMTPTTTHPAGLSLFPPPAGQFHGTDPLQGPSGTPANLGKIKDKQALADADPLGVDQNVDFDAVGGLQGHIDQLKEMVALPLLYPEVFQRFHVTPPRGVLFHGPPGTGKTLLARALASSVSSQGRKVTFYMRKGADALSKWVGEAERQLRLLFEEARKTQPSIIFFDEIDGK